MDWNKSNTILIVAFVILNIFLITTVFSDVFTESSNTVINSEEFLENVENLLEDKNIKISTEIPKDEYILPVLEIDYEIINVTNELIKKYLGEGIEVQEDVFIYSNQNNETLEIVNNKKIIYTIREKSKGLIGNKDKNKFSEKIINDFLLTNEITTTGFNKTYEFISDNDIRITYTQNYNNISIDNSYMCFYIDNDGIYKFEMQRADSVIDTINETKTITALEALPRLLTYDIKDKEITDIKMTYFSREDENWGNIYRTNADPTWMVEFSDGSQIHLPNFD